MNSYLNDKKRQKELHKKYLCEKKAKKKHIKYINKLFTRIFFSSLILLLLTYFTTFETNINKYLNKNLNFLAISSNLNSLFKSDFFNSGEVTVYSQAFYEEVRYENEVNYISNSSFAGIESLVDGVVIKIEKNNNLYNIYIQSSDDMIYKFIDLESIDVHLYSYVTQKEVIGKAVYKNNKYEFKLQIIKDSKYLNYYDNCEN